MGALKISVHRVPAVLLALLCSSSILSTTTAATLPLPTIPDLNINFADLLRPLTAADVLASYRPFSAYQLATLLTVNFTAVSFDDTNFADIIAPSTNLDSANYTGFVIKTVEEANKFETLEQVTNPSIRTHLIAYMRSLRKFNETTIAAKVNKWASSFDSAIFSSLAGSDDLLVRRGLIGDFFSDLGEAIVDVAKEIMCAKFATLSLGGYLAAADYLQFANALKTKARFTTHQKFFLAPVHGSYLGQTRVVYESSLPPGFGNGAVTMPHTIFVKGKKVPNDVDDLAITANVTAAFVSQVRLLLHELGHTRQYDRMDYSYNRFGWEYMRQYCLGGYKYSKNKLEIEAEEFRDNADDLLGYRGRYVFKRWRAKTELQRVLGFPTSPVSQIFTWTGFPNTRTLQFDDAVLELYLPAGGLPPCHRVWNGTDYTVRLNALTCRPPAPPSTPPCQDKPGLDPEPLKRRVVCTPTEPGTEPEYDPIAAARYCDEPKARLTSLLKTKPWQCSPQDD